MKLKKLLSILMCCMLSVSAVGCGGGGGGGGNIPQEAAGKTIIDIQIYDSGVNKSWLEDLSKEYAATLEGESFEEGKTGVYFKVNGVSDTEINAQSSSHFYVSQGKQGMETGRSLADEGLIAPITDIVTEPIDDRDGDGIKETSIKDKIAPEYYEIDLCANDGNCYALPNYGTKQGLTIDAYNFKYHGFYLAHPDTWNTQDARLVENKFGSAWFVNGSRSDELDEYAKLSVGNDGVAGTADDGMPTSLEEFLIMCAEMKRQGVNPLLRYNVGGRSFMYRAMRAAIDGQDAFQASYTYGGEEGTELQIVTGVTNKTMFGVDYVYEPEVKTVTVTRRTGHLASQTVGNYFAIVLLSIADQEGWYTDVGNNCSHIEGEERFVLNGARIGSVTNPKVGMLIEGDYWYNESKKAGAMEKFKKYVTNTTGRKEDFQWMYLPTLVTGSVTGVGEAINSDGTVRTKATSWDMPITNNAPSADGVLYNEHTETMKKGSCVYINKRYQSNAKLFEMLKGLMQFLYTDYAISYFTGSQGVFRSAMYYDVKPEHMENLSDFQKSTVAAFMTCERRTVPAQDPALYDYNELNAISASGQVLGDISGYVDLKGGISKIWDLFRFKFQSAKTFEDAWQEAQK